MTNVSAQKSEPKAQPKSPIVAGLDIGTTKVTIVIARVQPKTYEIIGVGHASSSGLRKGVVINIDATPNMADYLCSTQLIHLEFL